MKKPTNLYLLPASAYVYDDISEMSATLEHWEIKPIYKRAYSRYQAYIYIKRDLAIRLNSRFNCIAFDINDIVQLEEIKA